MFLDLPASTPELVAALGVVTRQTGFFRPADASGDGLGETWGDGEACDGSPKFFDQLIAHYCQCSGERWDDALEANLTFPRLFARQAYWREFPPTHVLARAIAVGLGVFKPGAAAEGRDGDVEGDVSGGEDLERDTIVIASEAKQFKGTEWALDCFASLAMTAARSSLDA